MVHATARLTPAALEARRARLPVPEFPPELPVVARRADIEAAIREHQVVVICGETGSGKTTQLPKMCLALGRGVAGLIGHTQPRRIAARTTAARIAYELKSELGTLVGYKIRFTDRMGADAYLKLMTDGILLAETQNDPDLRQYDTIIIDEAHERSLNIDFLLGYLKQLLPRRPDLKVIITSATIDAERFARHFGGAPVIEVSGRLHPVEVRYRPPDDDVEQDDAIAQATDELAGLGRGDILVFLPGEREIREAAEALRKHHPPGTELLPLYARLSAAEQERVFKSHSGRRIVLATNVAETSLTVPGIRYVIDTGLARVKRYSYRNKVEQLQIERISQAAARQRAGRCGRVASGVCIRLYAEDEFTKRSEYTDPEILRSSLAAVILRMKSLGLGAVETFPFIEPPAPKAIADGYALLQELGAVDEERNLLPLGRELAKLPVDPRIGRMILGAHREGTLAEVLVIAAALSVQDPRDRPLERAQAADAAHKRFADERSDFIAYLRLGAFFEEGLKHESQRKLRRLCEESFVSFNRMREWRDVHHQLKEIVAELGWKVGEPHVDPNLYHAIHRALLTGLLGNVGLRADDGSYVGARGIKFVIHPGSTLVKKTPRWAMSAELVDTTRLFARTVAAIEPEWIETVGAHLVRKQQFDPHWEKKPAQVIAFERATLYGIPLYTNRRVQYAPIDPREARRIFIRAALVEGDWDTRAPFFVHNRNLVRSIEALEHKSRRPDVLVDEALIGAFYESLVPTDVHDARTFDAWREREERTRPRLLFLKREDLMRHEAAGITTDQFPHSIELAGRRFALEYLHDPGGARDGVTMTVPLVALNQVSAARCDWLVPGLVKEKVGLLVKSLPQKLRHQLGPQAEFAERFAADVPPSDTRLADAIARYVRSEKNLVVPPDGFRPETLPAHLSMNFRVIDEHGRQLAIGRNLAQLRADLGGVAQEQFSRIAEPAADRARHTSWDFGALDEVMELKQGSQAVIGYPAIVDEGDGVSLQVFDAPEAAAAAHRAGLARLFALQLREALKFLEKSVPQALVLQFAAFGDANELRAQLVTATIDRVCLVDPLPRDADAFALRATEARSRLNLVGQEIARLVATILGEHVAVMKKLPVIKAFPEATRDIVEQLERLLPKSFLAATPYERLMHFPRYLKAIGMRIDKLRADPARDARGMSEIGPLQTLMLREEVRQRKQGAGIDPRLVQFRWLLEELRVQLFAQELRTPIPVSGKRLGKMWENLRT